MPYSSIAIVLGTALVPHRHQAGLPDVVHDEEPGAIVMIMIMIIIIIMNTTTNNSTNHNKCNQYD